MASNSFAIFVLPLFQFFSFFVVGYSAAAGAEFFEHQFLRCLHFVFFRDIISVFTNSTNETYLDTMFTFFCHIPLLSLIIAYIVSPRRESDSRPRSYQDLALPLSHLGIPQNRTYNNEPRTDNTALGLGCSNLTVCWGRELHPRSPYGRLVYSQMRLLLCHPSSVSL